MRFRSARMLSLLILALAALAPSALAQVDPSWRMMEDGKVFFAQKRFDRAIERFEAAKSSREAEYARVLAEFDTVLASPQGKAAGTYLSRLLGILTKRDIRAMDLEKIRERSGSSLLKLCDELEKERISEPLQDLVDALKAGIALSGQDSFGDSLPKLRALLEAGRKLPEAEHWIGKVYLSEGEYPIASEQFRKSIDQATGLGEGDTATEYRYDLVDLILLWRKADPSQAPQRLSDAESLLLAIAQTDGLYADPTQAGLLTAMGKSLDREGLDGFLALYRHDAPQAIRAWALLGEIYYLDGRYDAAKKHLMLAAEASATRLIAELENRDSSWDYSTVGELLGRLRTDESAAAWASEVHFDAILYYLGASLYKDGKPTAGRGIMVTLSRSTGDWAILAGRGDWAKVRQSAGVETELHF